MADRALHGQAQDSSLTTPPFPGVTWLQPHGLLAASRTLQAGLCLDSFFCPMPGRVDPRSLHGLFPPFFPGPDEIPSIQRTSLTTLTKMPTPSLTLYPPNWMYLFIFHIPYHYLTIHHSLIGLFVFLVDYLSLPRECRRSLRAENPLGVKNTAFHIGGTTVIVGWMNSTYI